MHSHTKSLVVQLPHHKWAGPARRPGWITASVTQVNGSIALPFKEPHPAAIGCFSQTLRDDGDVWNRPCPQRVVQRFPGVDAHEWKAIFKQRNPAIRTCKYLNKFWSQTDLSSISLFIYSLSVLKVNGLFFLLVYSIRLMHLIPQVQKETMNLVNVLWMTIVTRRSHMENEPVHTLNLSCNH